MPRAVRNLTADVSLVAAIAIAAGLLDALCIATGILGASGAFQYIPARLWTVAPLCWLALSTVLSIPLVTIFPRRGSVLAGVILLTFFMAGRFDGQPVAWIAVAIVATPAASAAGWWLARRWTSAPRPAAALASILLVASLVALAWIRPRPGTASGASASRSAPDIYVLFLDTVRYDDLDATMPAIASLARQSLVFDRAYSTSPWTLPAHFSAITGLPSHLLGVDFGDQRYQRPMPALAEILSRRGYRTAAVISNSFLNHGTGFDRGFDSFEQAENALDVCRTVPGLLADRHWPWFAATVCNWSASEVTSRALAQMKDDRRPRLLLLNYMDAHDPYYVERECRLRDFSASPPREAHRAALRCIDRNLGRLLNRIDASGRDSIVVLLSDHGEQFGEHGLLRHGNSLYVQLLHVPMMIRARGLTPRHVDAPVSIAALPALLRDLAPPTPSPIVSTLTMPGEKAPQWSAIGGRWHLITRDGREELYDLSTDPAERKNLAGSGVNVDDLRNALRHARPLIDRDTEKAFRSLGYIR